MRQRCFRIIERAGTSVLGIPDVGMLYQVILGIQYGPLPADKQKCILVIQHTDFIRLQKLPSALLEVGGVAAGFSFGLPVGVGVYGFFPQ